MTTSFIPLFDKLSYVNTVVPVHEQVQPGLSTIIRKLGDGMGCLFAILAEGGGCLIRGKALVRARALVRAWALTLFFFYKNVEFCG